MRYIALLLVAHLLGSAVSVAQEGSPFDASAAPPVPTQSYAVQLTEFRLKSATDPTLTASDIVKTFEQMRNDGKVDLIEIIRLSALEGQESSVQIGKAANVTIAMTAVAGGRPPMRQMQTQTVGTSARVTAVGQGGKVLLNLSYEASRFEGPGQEDSPPDTVTVQFNTTLLIEPGKPTLVGGTSAEATHLLLVSISDY